MSSPRLNYNRKRRSDYETSDSGDSEDEYTPVRKIRKCRKETSTVPNFLLSIKQSFASRCRTLWQWISELPLKDYFKETMYKNSLIYSPPADVVVIDDDEEEDVIPVEDEDDDDDIAVIYETNDHSPPPSHKYREQRQDSFLKSLSTDEMYSPQQKNRSRYKMSEIGSVRRPFNGSDPLTSSTPFVRGDRPIMDVSYVNSGHRQVNGFHNNHLVSKSDLKGESVLSKSKRRISPITNPGVDVEILLDTNGSNVEDSDDLEIISEVSKVNKSSHLPKVKATYKLSRSLRDCAATSQDATLNGNSNSEHAAENGHSLATSYTAHEVVRLQEKAQYQLLLDKLVKGSIYHPVIKKPDSRSAHVQVNLEDDDDEPIISNHFKKEDLKVPVSDFLKKYYKPCLIKSPPPPERNSHLHIAPEAAAKDDDIKVVDIKPLPEYRRRPKPRSDFFSADWIEELKQTISSETEKRLQIVAEQEQKIERYRSRRDAKIAEENRQRDELMNVMLPRVKVEKEDEFPALTSDMDNVIDAAFEAPPNQVFSTINKVAITQNDIAALKGLSWLNDNIINAYLQLIVERSKLDNFPTVYAFNTFFYTSLKTRGENNVLRWTRRIDIFSYDIILVPLHLGMHWALAVIDNRTKKIQYYDSMRSHDNSCLHDLQRYLIVEMKDKKKTVIDSSYFTLESMKDIPQQMNGSDCGMFTLKYAEYVSRDAPITFTQQNMQYFRRKMVYEVVTAQLL